jgi:hypothetical protein
VSSRSHTILTLYMETEEMDKNGNLRKSKLNFCDLAGSEKLEKSSNSLINSEHFAEMVKINLSLTTLGKVIHQLSIGKNNHIQYRDSKLTRLLQDSLGGNSKTFIISTISPCSENFEESLSTLKFSDRAKSIMQKAEPNYIQGNDENLIKKLNDEINNLKAILNLRRKRGVFGEFEDQFIKLKEENEKMKKIQHGSNIEQLIKENKILKLELQKFKNTFSTMDDNPVSLRRSEKSTIDNDNLKESSINLVSSQEIKSDMKNYLHFSEKISNRNRNTIKYLDDNKDTKNSEFIPSRKKSKFINSSNNLSEMTNDILNLRKHSMSQRDISNDMKEIKNAKSRLKFLEEMEKKTSCRMLKEIDRIQNDKKKKDEQRMMKLLEV